jgi:hypothetical protein
MGAPLLGPDAPKIVGLTEETTCYVSLAYFREGDPFADFVVHEAAHIFRAQPTGEIRRLPDPSDP